ncbi:MAG: potassium-transporting ATPase subunit C [Planctomycetes bacterium]|nr:potassium-transporting ATPase subunit C [Planctomycetota bacterium]
MLPHLRANLWLMALTLLICSVFYPAALLGLGQTLFRDQANGSIIVDEHGQPLGSRLIAQPFTADEYFQPRPSAASYNGAASNASNWGASNHLLRERVERQLGPIVKYRSGLKKGERVAPDISFDKWRQEHPDADLETVPADMVMASGSGLDPHITLKNALYQLDRVSAKWAERTGRDAAAVRNEIESLLHQKAEAPLDGLAGVDLINVLEVNLALRERLGR